jgi:hypothetical protein
VPMTMERVTASIVELGARAVNGFGSGIPD